MKASDTRRHIQHAAWNSMRHKRYPVLYPEDVSGEPLNIQAPAVFSAPPIEWLQVKNVPVTHRTETVPSTVVMAKEYLEWVEEVLVQCTRYVRSNISAKAFATVAEHVSRQSNQMLHAIAPLVRTWWKQANTTSYACIEVICMWIRVFPCPHVDDLHMLCALLTKDEMAVETRQLLAYTLCMCIQKDPMIRTELRQIIPTYLDIHLAVSPASSAHVYMSALTYLFFHSSV